MAFVFKFPDLGEGVHEGKIVKWLVKVGDAVKPDQVIAEAETDTAVVEMPSPTGGTILQINFKEGEVIQVGTPFIVIGEPGEAIPPDASPSAAPSHAPSAAAPTPASKPAAHAPAPVPSTPSPVPSALAAPSGTVMATPATRQIARELGVDISKVRGTGPGGRILPEDVKAFAASGEGSHAPSPTATSSAAPTAPARKSEPLVFHGPVERAPMSMLRKAVSAKMTQSWTSIPQATHIDAADVTELWAVREREKAHASAQGIHLTLLPFAVKAVVETLKKYPVFNASLDEGTQEIVYKKYYHIGIAVETEDGLIVVVVKDADKKNVLALGKEINELAEKARTRKVSLDEIKGSTLTITNIGSVGGTSATPIINHPESAIVGLYRMREHPMVKDGQIVVRKMMPLSIGYDHRIIDGATAARFINEVIALLQTPSSLPL